MTRIKSMAAALLVAATVFAGGQWAGVLGPAEAAAQTPPAGQDRPARPDGRFGRGMLYLPEQFELTAEQKAQVEQIRAELAEKNRPLMEQVRSIVDGPEPPARQRERARRGRRMPRLTPEQREQVRPLLEQMRENRRAAHEQVMALLTPEQKQTLEKLRAEQAERRRERGPRGQRGPGHDHGATQQQR
ncbi:MAG TPA: Spy/CpxP family protein refolding chaperone [Longimicrobiales bacterium]